MIIINIIMNGRTLLSKTVLLIQISLENKIFTRVYNMFKHTKTCFRVHIKYKTKMYRPTRFITVTERHVIYIINYVLYFNDM